MLEEHLTLVAPAIECEGCASSIKRSLGRLPGVHEISVDVVNKTITVSFDSTVTSEQAIRTRLDVAGFPAR